MRAIPNAFYDLMVFVAPAALLVIGISFGAYGLDIASVLSRSWSASDLVAVAGGLLILAYEYGRLAEAWSAYIVQRPIRWIGRHSRVFADPDYLRLLDDEVDHLKLQGLPSDRRGNKWTIYFYAFLANPALGSDLLKRYAWEKLARSSAFTDFVLLSASAMMLAANALHALPSPRPWTFGTVELTVALGFLTAITYVEYYRRNAWNNDLLRLVLPVLLEARGTDSRHEEASTSVPPRTDTNAGGSSQRRVVERRDGAKGGAGRAGKAQ